MLRNNGGIHYEFTCKLLKSGQSSKSTKTPRYIHILVLFPLISIIPLPKIPYYCINLRTKSHGYPTKVFRNLANFEKTTQVMLICSILRGMLDINTKVLSLFIKMRRKDVQVRKWIFKPNFALLTLLTI